jgi:hypothetical protein
MRKMYEGIIDSVGKFPLVEDNSKTFQDLIIWQKAHSLVLEIYSVTKTFLKEELFAFSNQLRRAAISVPANIAEGFGRLSKVEKNLSSVFCLLKSINQTNKLWKTNYLIRLPSV